MLKRLARGNALAESRLSKFIPLSDEQYLDLLLGPQNSSSAFANERERCRAWQQSKVVLQALVESGSRPSAWWDYDAPELPGPRESAPEFLARHGLLSEAEAASMGRLRVGSAGHKGG